MMERTLSPEDLERLAACRSIVAAKGASSPYVADCVVRAYQGAHVQILFRDLGWHIDRSVTVVIVAGIGTLRMAWTGNQLESTSAKPMSVGVAPAVEVAARLPAASAVRAHRERLCASCTHRGPERCTVAGCACAGLGEPAARFSRCPVGKW